MNPGRRRPVPGLTPVVAAVLVLGLGGCFGPDLTPGADALAGGEAASPERAAAVAEMRQRGAAADAQPYPDVFQAEQTARLAARPEPRPASDAAAIEAELAAIAQLQKAASTPEDLAELQARAEELRRKSEEQAAQVHR